MSGFSKLYVIGGQEGIEALILVGDTDRQWLEARYLAKGLRPMGSVRSIVPAGPNHPDALMDACLAFCPKHFASCPSLAEVEAALAGVTMLDFDKGGKEIPAAWARLREEARPIFSKMSIREAELVPVHHNQAV